MAVLATEIADLEEVLSQPSPFLTSWRLLVPMSLSATAATLALEFTASLRPETVAIVAGLTTFIVVSVVLTIPDRRRRRELERRLEALKRALADASDETGP